MKGKVRFLHHKVDYTTEDAKEYHKMVEDALTEALQKLEDGSTLYPKTLIKQALQNLRNMRSVLWEDEKKK